MFPEMPPRHDRAALAAWIGRLAVDPLPEGVTVNAQTAEISSEGVDLSQLRANRQLTPTERLRRMVAATNKMNALRGTIPGRRPA